MTDNDPFADTGDDVPPFPDRSGDIGDQKDEDDVVDSEEARDPTRKSTIIDTLAENIEIGSISQIVVCEPIEKQDAKTGLIKWVEYKVISEKSDGSQAEVFRRYSHFLWLRKLLWQEFKGIIVPPLPEKKNFGRFQAAFVERRRRRLEQFLNRLAIHPFLKDSPVLHVFLNVQESEMFAQALKGDSTSLSEKASSAYNSFRTTKQKLLKPPGDTEDDKECARIKEYGINLEQIGGAMEGAFLGLDNECRGVGMAWETTAETLQQLSEFESEEGNERSSFCLSTLGETCQKVGSLRQDPESISTFTTIKLRDLFDDFSKYGKAIKECVEGRDQLYYQHLAEVSTLESRNKSLSALETGSYVVNRESRVESTKKSILDSEEKVATLENEINTVTDRLQTEVQAFQKTKPSRIESKLLAFADFQLEQCEAMAEYWREFKDQLSE